MNTFDINDIINAAINAAIQQAIEQALAPLKQELAALKAQPQVIQPADNPAAGTDMVLAKEVTLKLLQDNAAVKQAVYEIAYDAGHAVLGEHLESYDHDAYDRAVSAIDDADLDSLPDFDDFVKHDDLGETIEEKINEIVDMDEYVKGDDLPEFPDVDTLVTKDALFEAVREEVRNTIENRVSVSLYLS